MPNQWLTPPINAGLALETAAKAVMELPRAQGQGQAA